MALLSSLRFAIPIVAFFAIASHGCRVSVDYGDTAFACSEGECPGGYTCEQNICVSDDALAPPEADARVIVEADASPPDAQALAACNDAFSMAPGYELCSEDELSCSFNVNTAGGTCAQACTLLGSTCLAAFDNNDILCEPVPATGDTCDTPRASEVCVCARVAL